MAAILVIARLCEPYIAESWYRKTALEDLLQVGADRVNDDRLYRALDQLLVHKEELQKHLMKRIGELFELDYELLLYDVISTYFEGQAERNPMAKRGHSRDSHPDCKQVCIALVVTRQGMPLGYEVFDDNRINVTTVEQIVGTMEARYGLAHRVWVIGANKTELKHLAAELHDRRNWEAVREGVEAKRCQGPDGTELFVLVRSEQRKAKEQAIYERFAKRIEQGLASLGRRIDASRKALDRAAIERQIGRLLGKTPALPLAIWCRSSRLPAGLPPFVCSGPFAPNGMIGRDVAKAATCCAPISPIGPPRSCGSLISSSLRPKLPFASTSVDGRRKARGSGEERASCPDFFTGCAAQKLPASIPLA